MDLTTFLATWGALLSTLAIGWNLYRDISDRGKIKLNCFIGNVIGGVEPTDKDYLLYVVTNVGRRPVMITSIGGSLKGTKHFMLTSKILPKMLQPGEYFTEHTEDLSIINKNPRFLAAWDSAGKIWKLEHKLLKKLHKQLDTPQKNSGA